MHLNARLTIQLRLNDSDNSVPGSPFARTQNFYPTLNEATILSMQPPVPRAEAATFIRRPLVHLSADVNRCAIFWSIPTEICWPLHCVCTPVTNTYRSISSATHLSLPPQRYGGALQIRLFPRQVRLLRFIHSLYTLFICKKIVICERCTKKLRRLRAQSLALWLFSGYV